MLLKKGEGIYHELAGEPEKLQTKIADLVSQLYEYTETLLEEVSTEAEEGQHRIRMLLNGMMDAAGAEKDAREAVELKELLECLFGEEEDF